ncbi:hypothetical protein TcasGA2_TC033760 [Tribolium castaneum]|uniref:Uncharacterized protein n=1 Tax=Tribolium castaneum TaxID=7070 RepID=A0A139WET0_TRICA|nr:hypothetical protein TcasGA2_TC033760 [Tribolium castaneum]
MPSTIRGKFSHDHESKLINGGTVWGKASKNDNQVNSLKKPIVHKTRKPSR